MELDLLNVTASELQRLLTDGKITSLDLVRQYHAQILKHNDRLKAMISISPLPHLEKIAAKLDEERRRGVVRGGMHGVPFIVKDAMDTSSEFQLESTNAIWELENPSGSSTGSAVAISAGFAPLSMGADFNGSLTNPATRAALYTIRTTPGIVSEHGCFPFSKDRDSVGPMAKSVEDLVGLLNVVVDVEHPGVPDQGYGTGVSREWRDVSFATLDPGQKIRETNAAYEKIASLAKRVVGPVDLITDEALDESMNDVLTIINNDFSNLFEAYTDGLISPKVKTLKQLIDFNERHREIELPALQPCVVVFSTTLDTSSTAMQQLKGGIREYRAFKREILQEAKSNVFTYDTKLKHFVQTSPGNSTPETFEEINSFLDRRVEDSAPLTQDDDLVATVNFVEMPLPHRKTSSSPLSYHGFSAENVIRSHVQCLLSGFNHTTTTGRLCDEDKHDILFETPVSSVPYIRLSLNRGESQGVRRRWQVILAYDGRGFPFELSFWTFERHMEGYGLERDPNPDIADEPFRAFASVLHKIVLHYVQAVGNDLKACMTGIQDVEKSVDSEERPSSLLRRLNAISRDVRAASLKEKFVFSMDAAKWADAIFKPLRYMDEKENLLLVARGVEQYHPDRLREVLIDVHQHIEDVVAEKQQEKQEQLQEQEEKRKKDRYKLQNDQKAEEKIRARREGELLEQSIRIAKETKRDSRTMRGIAWVTIAFLPATFVTSFFGMNFFNGIAGKVPFDEASRNVWLFFAIAIPVSGIVLLIFYLWDKQAEKKDDGKLPSVEDGTMTDQQDAATQCTDNDFELSALPSRVSHS
ncbi:hypothetical protein J4E83_008779 [Alternaria metachromatica]|uniref:uncharacterized protein n=1 Tax=Alternaria metachromatica TaxID=283354 RepID=UPI0020C1DBD5|nr:uncharacterized protein J4E83_008779 [Alternaria metachromatica]KAI4609138.1 hypothetical protein J4E83_008779 [Alternaria metachromatica]